MGRVYTLINYVNNVSSYTIFRFISFFVAWRLEQKLKFIVTPKVGEAVLGGCIPAAERRLYILVTSG